MLNIISSENPQNNINNQSSSVSPQFINRKREKKFKVKKENKRNDNKRREYFWSVFSFLMEFISKQFGLEFNLNFQKQFEAIYGCTIKNMRKVLSFKIFEIISLFKNAKLTEKGNSIIDAYAELKKNFTKHETFVFLMECTYDQLLEFYFKNDIEPKKNVNISSFIQMIKKDKSKIMNAIKEIKTKEGRKERNGTPLEIDELMSSFRNFEEKYLEKDDEDNAFNNFNANRLTNYTTQNVNIEYMRSNIENQNNNLYETNEFNFLNNQDMSFSESEKDMNSSFSLDQNNDSFTNFHKINSNNCPSPIPLNNYENI